MSGHLFIFGYGYVAGALTERLQPRGWKISASARRLDKAGALTAAGIPATVFGPHGFTDFARTLSGVTHILITAPPGEDGDPVLRAHTPGLEALTGLQGIVYLSTTGVYGDANGAWVDEAAPITPVHERGNRRADAELEWNEIGEMTGAAVTVLRLPGIYGPGRSAFDRLRDGTARRLVKPGQVFSRIHVDDIVQAIEASLALDHGTVLNIADDEPAPPQDVITEAARLLGVEPPPEEDFETAKARMTPMALEFYSANRRIANARMKAELGLRLIHPTYREGLRAILAAEGNG
ncbi:MAG: SDR family oxidoreductase [Micropepsaceae bacterium]